MDKKKLVVDVFKKEGKPLKTGDISRILGFDTKEVSKIIRELKNEGIIFSPKRCYYSLKVPENEKKTKILNKSILMILVDKRKKDAPTVQKILTAWGCIIKTRLGIHDGVLDECSDTGLIILELVGDEKKHKELKNKLNKLDGVRAKLINIKI